MTHTPGPWTVNKYRSIGAGEHGTRPIVAHVEPFYGTDRQYGDDTANARLIAAAPDMLAALCLAQDTLTPPRGDEEQEALAAITAAIAKAQGNG